MLATFRIHKDKSNPYVIMHKGFLNDLDISWRAKGVLAYLLSKPDDWQVQVKDITGHAVDGERSARSAIGELMEFGYMSKRVIRESGKFARFEYDVFESPELNPVFHYIVREPFCTNGQMVKSAGGKDPKYYTDAMFRQMVDSVK